MAEADGGDLAWWFVSATRPYMQAKRPYMRAIQAMGILHKENGETEGARRCFEQLLEMNPNDNQGIRYLVAELDEAVVFSV